ncbi:nucleoside phosphorylase [Maribacter polysaccharolyticus]|uniref:nucleoside phosphorylase n=1 Tax=Maribacter polysaccharolyticus TaxID=3020831 RepID=UPI00237F701A|nr:nucleoside phosphorylase [Maribacter polysaccharolyticus]MDE3740546.1 nucleoside phosphorylase [Maribacter polysaccharolyticus]
MLEASELILNADNSIYHLNLLPEDIADTIIIVGDQNRVPEVSKHFDSIEVKKEKREFVTHTGVLKGKRITALSTGIGADNIDIVINELDALANIDFKTRKIKKKPKQLKIIRIGTSGAIQKDIPVDSFVMSEYALGFDGVLHFYKHEGICDEAFSEAFVKHTDWSDKKPWPYLVPCDASLRETLASNRIRYGVTLTNSGFYGPQGRKLRLDVQDPSLNDKIANFKYGDLRITNLEMESSAIYGLCKLLGHQALSMNCIIANRVLGEFSENPRKTINSLIAYTLDRLTR